MNKVILIGRLTRDPEVKYSAGEGSMAIARYSLAVDRVRKDADGNNQADFISCVALGKNGEFAEKYPFLEPYFNNKDYDEIKEFTEGLRIKNIKIIM